MPHKGKGTEYRHFTPMHMPDNEDVCCEDNTPFQPGNGKSPSTGRNIIACVTPTKDEMPFITTNLCSVLPDLDVTPFCNNGIATPDLSILDQLEPEVPNSPDKLQSVRGMVGRPLTKVFIQNKVFTYNSLPSINQGNCLTKAKKVVLSKVAMPLVTTLNPNALSFTPSLRVGNGEYAASILND